MKLAAASTAETTATATVDRSTAEPIAIATVHVAAAAEETR